MSRNAFCQFGNTLKLDTSDSSTTFFIENLMFSIWLQRFQSIFLALHCCQILGKYCWSNWFNINQIYGQSRNDFLFKCTISMLSIIQLFNYCPVMHCCQLGYTLKLDISDSLTTVFIENLVFQIWQQRFQSIFLVLHCCQTLCKHDPNDLI